MVMIPIAYREWTMDDSFMHRGWTGDGSWMIVLCTMDGPGMDHG
jgi:hypothetical protein